MTGRRAAPNNTTTITRMMTSSGQPSPRMGGGYRQCFALPVSRHRSRSSTPAPSDRAGQSQLGIGTRLGHGQVARLGNADAEGDHQGRPHGWQPEHLGQPHRGPDDEGLYIDETMKMLRSVRGKNIIGGDVVCLMPTKDAPNNITALTAAAVMFEMISIISEKIMKS